MPPIPTGPTEIDRKLHRIVLEANPGQFTNLIALARAIEQSRFSEFSYRRSDRTEYSNADTIASYVAFAREIGLLDENIGPTRPKGDVRALASFQQWLSDKVARYLSDRGSSPAQISSAVRSLLNANPAELPSQENIRSRLSNPPSPSVFRVCLKIMALLRPNVLKVVTRRVVLIPGVLRV